MATSDFIIFIDADDYISSNAIEELLKYKDYDLIRSIREYVFLNSKEISKESLTKTLTKNDLMNYIACCYITGVFISRYVYTKITNLFKNLKFNVTNIVYYEDMIFHYLTINFSNNFINSSFIYSQCLTNNKSLITTLKKETSFYSAENAILLCNEIKPLLISTNELNVPIEFIIFRLCYLMRMDAVNKKEKLESKSFMELNNLKKSL